MVNSVYIVGIYAVPAMLIACIYLLLRRRQETLSRRYLEDARSAGLTEPASLHPIIDASRCIGCRSCISACPEGDVLGLVGGIATLVNPTDCIGHGACEKACPESAISLVFGTETRGVDIPDLSPNFETSVPGIFVAGELGGMGLIKNAITQGQQAMRAITASIRADSHHVPADWDCVVVGCGPAGLSASLEARSLGLKSIALDRSRVGGTVAHFPRRKLVMTAPVELAGVGRVHFREVSKEDLMAFWQKTLAEQKPCLKEGETLNTIRINEDGSFVVETDKGSYHAKKVLLALGRRGVPRTLDVPGESLGKVVYELDDPTQYAERHVLVVGGGDSAIEAAYAVAQANAAAVTLSYRGEAFARAKRKNREKIMRLQADGKVDIRLSSNVIEIADEYVLLNDRGETVRLQNDDVIICVGGELPIGFMRDLGIAISTKYGRR